VEAALLLVREVLVMVCMGRGRQPLSLLPAEAALMTLVAEALAVRMVLTAKRVSLEIHRPEQVVWQAQP
jgi:hypothetical protein